MRIIRKRSQRYALGNSMFVQEPLLLFINTIPKAFSLNNTGITASRNREGVLNLFFKFAWLLFFLSLSAPDGMIVSRRRREICQSEVRDSARGRLKFYPE